MTRQVGGMRSKQAPLKPVSAEEAQSLAASMGEVAVLMGGLSAEREISLRSGQGVLAALRSQGVRARAFDPAEHPLDELKARGISRVFIALHGRYGEDGTVQGRLSSWGFPTRVQVFRPRPLRSTKSGPNKSGVLWVCPHRPVCRCVRIAIPTR